MKNQVNLACRRSREFPEDIYAHELAPNPNNAANIDSSEQAEFVADCEGWNVSSFDVGTTIEVTMPAHRWKDWLAKYNWDVEED